MLKFQTAEGNRRAWSGPLVAGILNFLLPEKKIKTLSFLDREQHGLAISDKNSTFDLYCKAENGEEFIVEMQGARTGAGVIIFPQLSH